MIESTPKDPLKEIKNSQLAEMMLEIVRTFTQDSQRDVNLAARYCETVGLTPDQIAAHPTLQKYRLGELFDDERADQDPLKIASLVTNVMYSEQLMEKFVMATMDIMGNPELMDKRLGMEFDPEDPENIEAYKGRMAKYFQDIISDISRDLTGEIHDTLNECFRIEAMAEREKGFLNSPTSPAVELITRGLSYAGTDNLNQLPERVKKGSSRHKNLDITTKVEDGEETIQFRETSKTGDITVEISAVEGQLSRNTGARKLLRYILTEACKGAIIGGDLVHPSIGFPLKSLTDLGVYNGSNKPNAKDPMAYPRRAFTRDMKTLQRILVQGEITQGKKKKISQSSLTTLFPHSDISKGGYCTIDLNYRINWQLLTTYYTILPTWVFRLNDRSFDLACHIFNMARQNTRQIEERGYFTIGFRNIQTVLNLPSERGNDHPAQTIKNVIERAVDDCMNWAITDMTLTMVYDESAHIRDYLDNGYLKVELNGEYKDHFINLAKAQEKKIQESKKRKQRVIEKAQAGAMQKAIENADSDHE